MSDHQPLWRHASLLPGWETTPVIELSRKSESLKGRIIWIRLSRDCKRASDTTQISFVSRHVRPNNIFILILLKISCQPRWFVYGVRETDPGSFEGNWTEPIIEVSTERPMKTVLRSNTFFGSRWESPKNRSCSGKKVGFKVALAAQYLTS